MYATITGPMSVEAFIGGIALLAAIFLLWKVLYWLFPSVVPAIHFRFGHTRKPRVLRSKTIQQNFEDLTGQSGVRREVREYGSLDEMPEELRRRFEHMLEGDEVQKPAIQVTHHSIRTGAPGDVSDAPFEASLESASAEQIEIVINGKRHIYNSIAEVPEEFRRMLFR
ncbi:hypothetical protein JXA32_14170 [Candidatus Sumerlaeota bacterium]|nr:hypothetical protein [Candidatus Sumerlaeota bacterium]